MSETLNQIKNYPEVNFIDDYTLDEMAGDMVDYFQQKYKELTGKEMELAVADPNRLILHAAALQIYQGFQHTERSGKRNLLKYSYGPFLENIGGLKGITRSDGSYAVTTMRFTLSETRPSVITIPEGTRVTNGTQVFFETTEVAEIPVGEMSVDVPARALEMGSAANNIEIGEIRTLVDTLAYIDKVTNLTRTQGGADIEDDESLRERIFLSPRSYSVAGPTGAYEFHTKSYSPAIVDVKVTSPTPGVVYDRFLLKNGELPSTALCESVYEYLDDAHKRPLTDQLFVEPPEPVPYNVRLTYYIGRSNIAVEETVKKEVLAAIDKYNEWQQTVIGRDINPDELIKLTRQAGAKRLVITEPQFQVIPDISVGQLQEIEILYGGIEDD